MEVAGATRVALLPRSNAAPKEHHLSPRPGRMGDLAADTVAERLRDRATRSATLAALESHADLSTRLGAAVRARDVADKRAEDLRIELVAVRATLDELGEKHGVERSLLELQTELRKEELAAATRVADAERPLREAVDVAEARTSEAQERAEAAQRELKHL